MSHIWVIERKLENTDDEYSPSFHGTIIAKALRRVARALQSNFNTNYIKVHGERHIYRVRKYVRVD